EIANLHKVYASKLGDEKYATVDIMLGNTKARSNTIANISFDDLHFKFTTGGKTRYFSLLQTAPGRSFHKILKEFGELAKAKDLDDEELLIAYKKTKHIFYRVGFAMSELHQKYNPNNERNPLDLSNTLIHGDLHSENIFYDEDSDKVTLIDNETFAFSLSNPCSGVNDIVDLYMVHTIRLIAHNLTNQFTSNEEFGINDTLWHELWRHLFYGYFDAFGDISKEDFDVLYAEVRKDFFKSFSHLNIFSALKNLVDQRKLKRLGLSDRRKYIQKIELVRLFERTYNSHAKQYEIP
ncbi:MAG TPA: hypothetical protein VEK06_02660, partial [Myxococcota bacterium]|nr:hypothetical protein [Myxococcota bacterium]